MRCHIVAGMSGLKPDDRDLQVVRASEALQYAMVAVNRTKLTALPSRLAGSSNRALGASARLGMEPFMDVKYVCGNWA